MKMNYWLICGAMLSTSVLAQQVTSAPPAGPIRSSAAAPAAAPAKAAAPAAKKQAPASAKKAPANAPAAKKAAGSELRTVPLVPGPAVVDANNVNVRGQAKLASEVVTRLTKGQSVTVIEEITLKNSGPSEPSAWAKIVLPPEVHVFVNSAYIDPAKKTVKPKKLNLRSGPGENYSVLGVMAQGDTVREIATKGAWIQIEAPANAYAFVAAQYLKQEASAPPVAVITPPVTTPPVAVATPPTTPTPPPSPTPLPEAPTIAAPPTTPPTTPPATPPVAASSEAPETPGAEAPVMTPAPAPEPVLTGPPPKRVVQREGWVRGTSSIQAPTKFELVSVDTHRTIDYIYTSSPNLDLSRYKGLRIIITGEEGLDERWGNTPVLTIQKIQVVE
jgi:uncharacterized protein YgiM (DUF1202 family)